MKRIFLLVFLFVFSSVARAAAVPPKVDHRGLVEIPGVLRAHTGHHWGAANLVVWGKPFTVTEWNFCNPNKWRAEAGLMMGAYASLQDWDGLYRFAWSHSRDNMFKPCPAKGFDIVTDPIGQLTERQVALLFGRRDASPAKVPAEYRDGAYRFMLAITPGSPDATMIYELAK